MNQLVIALGITLTLILNGCASQSSAPASKRQAVLAMKDKTLAHLFLTKPDVRAQINNAPGYAVFSNANVNIIFASFGGGYGVVKDNRNGRHTYMRMGELGIGLGAGVKDFRLIFVFHSPQAMERFLQFGWSFAGNADAAAKASDMGGAYGKSVYADNVTVYEYTESGLALQATLKGSKFWKDKELN